MTFDQFNAYCLAKKGVTVDYPFKGEAAWFKVMGKMFALANVTELKMGKEMVGPFHFINLKCDPDRAEALREQYEAVQGGWHQNKTHWNSLIMDGSLPDDLILELTDHSYELVKESLSGKLKAELKDL